jgi:hypothetical protein
MKNHKNTAVLLLALSLLLSSCTGDTVSSDSNTTSAETSVVTDESTADIQADPEESKYVNADFSLPGGFYSKGQTLTLALPSNAPDGAYITYTLDGNEPDKNSEKYTGEITVANDGTSVVRAACFDADGNLVGRVITHSYIKAKSDRVALYTDKVYVTTLCVDYDAGTFTSMNGNITVVTTKSGVSVVCSNDDRVLKEWDWFKNNRACPENWK